MQPNDYAPMGRQDLTRRALLIIGALVILIGLIVGGVQLYKFMNRKTVTLKPIEGTRMIFGPATDNEESLGITKQLLDTNSGKNSVKVAPGYYAATVSGEGYQTTTFAVTVEDDTTVNSPDYLSYNNDKLSGMLAAEETAVAKAIPEVADGRYTISDSQSQLYGKGDWFAGRLIPKNTAVDDQLVVVLHKENGQWKVAAGPAMVLALSDYPDVPEDAIRTVNNNYNVEINEGAQE